MKEVERYGYRVHYRDADGQAYQSECIRTGNLHRALYLPSRLTGRTDVYRVDILETHETKRIQA